MPIEIKHTPVGTLMNLSRIAGEEQQRRESAAGDLAFTQMALSAQTQNNQIAAMMQRDERAFQLQQAAVDRQSRTAMRAATARGPVVQEFDSVLGRMKQTRAWGQEDQARQLQQLDVMRAAGQYSDAEIEGERLRIMAGRATGLPIKKEKPERIGLTPAQIESRKRTLFTQKREDLEAERNRILEESEYADFERTSGWEKKLTEATAAIQEWDAKYRSGITDDVVPGVEKETRVTEDMARQLLREAGGDKQKARALARQKGLRF